MERDPENGEILYELIGGVSPAVASGTYRGATFEFRARWDNWDFVLTSSTAYPACVLEGLCAYDLDRIQRSEKPYPSGLIEAFKDAFVRKGGYGAPNSWAASYMPADQIRRLVRELIAEYEGRRTSGCS